MTLTFTDARARRSRELTELSENSCLSHRPFELGFHIPDSKEMAGEFPCCLQTEIRSNFSHVKRPAHCGSVLCLPFCSKPGVCHPCRRGRAQIRSGRSVEHLTVAADNIHCKGRTNNLSKTKPILSAIDLAKGRGMYSTLPCCWLPRLSEVQS